MNFENGYIPVGELTPFIADKDMVCPECQSKLVDKGKLINKIDGVGLGFLIGTVISALFYFLI